VEAIAEGQRLEALGDVATKIARHSRGSELERMSRNLDGEAMDFGREECRE
jgi:hypothetical protein